MKKYMIFIIALVTAMNVQAQVDDFIFKEYDSVYQTFYLDDRLFDINDDDIPDFRFYTYQTTHYLACQFYTLNNWECCGYSNEEYPGVINIFRDLSLPLNDSTIGWDIHFMSEFYSVHCDTLVFKNGLRNKIGENYYYGWIEAYLFSDWRTFCSIKVARTCYCTIPNYSLIWGQTSITQGFEETESTIFATVHPNPTMGQVIITGFNLKQAQVFNTLGQRVATAKGEDERLIVDISSLPTGIYFVTITDEEGRKCVKKVVKE